ncbi:MAG: type II toxin-antitoxin system PemK/MazF family toxin [Candidatus Diapherotrites archaeon]|nr:type II toxin-antitoxin system PemK/MazF family toxin [Candidatus Diapherotrites archaeon]
MMMRRGDIVLAKLDPVVGSEQGKTRPCLVVQNDLSNELGPTTIIVPFTSTITDKCYPTAVIVEAEESGLNEKSAILCNQIRTISAEHRIIKKISTLKPIAMLKVDDALRTSLGLD